MKHPPFRNLLLGVIGAIAALVTLTFARGGGTAASSQSLGSQPDSTSVGLTVAKDAETGQLRAPTAEEMAALRPAGSTERGQEIKLRSERLANGAVVTTLNSSYDLYSVAVQGEDGKIHRACVPADRLEEAKSGKFTTEEALHEK